MAASQNIREIRAACRLLPSHPRFVEEKILTIAGKEHELMKALHVGKDGATLKQTKMLGSLFNAPWFRARNIFITNVFIHELDLISNSVK